MGKQLFTQRFVRRSQTNSPRLILEDGARVAVIGGGPGGAFFSYFLLDMAQRVGQSLHVDVYEPRDFSLAGPPGCNRCAGIISESLVQHLASEGINLSPTVVQRGIDSYILHMDVGSVRLAAPHAEKRIGAVFRGAGPLGMTDSPWSSFDGFLLAQARSKGANLIRARVDEVQRVDGRVQVTARGQAPQLYDLLAVAAGVKTSILKLFQSVAPDYRPPLTVQTTICEYRLGVDTIGRQLGNSMHVFLLDLPGLDFAAIIPKGDYVTVCLLGEDRDGELLEAFLHSPVVQRCMPPGWQPEQFACRCAPRINIAAAVQPFADRVVFLADCGVTRLYKNGIGAAHRTAKAAAATAIFHGIAAEDFRGHFWPTYQEIATDNALGKVIFGITRQIQHRRFARRAVSQMVSGEQHKPARERWMSTVLWDTFTGSAPYQEIFRRCLHPAFWIRWLWHLGASLVNPRTLRHQSASTNDSLLAG